MWTPGSGVEHFRPANRGRSNQIHSPVPRPSRPDSRGSYGSKPHLVSPHRGGFVKMHCALNVIQLSHKTLQKRKGAARRGGRRTWPPQLLPTCEGVLWQVNTSSKSTHSVCTVAQNTHSQTACQGPGCLASDLVLIKV